MDVPAAPTLPADGLAVFVKRACPTCTLVEKELARAAHQRDDFFVVSQDDVRFPANVARIIDDRALDLSWLNEIEATPTLVRYTGGRESERVAGWDREAWRRLTGIADLGADLPAFRPG